MISKRLRTRLNHQQIAMGRVAQTLIPPAAAALTVAHLATVSLMARRKKGAKIRKKSRTWPSRSRSVKRRKDRGAQRLSPSRKTLVAMPCQEAEK